MQMSKRELLAERVCGVLWCSVAGEYEVVRVCLRHGVESVHGHVLLYSAERRGPTGEKFIYKALSPTLPTCAVKLASRAVRVITILQRRKLRHKLNWSNSSMTTELQFEGGARPEPRTPSSLSTERCCLMSNFFFFFQLFMYLRAPVGSRGRSRTHPSPPTLAEQGARRGTKSWDPGILTWTEGRRATDGAHWAPSCIASWQSELLLDLWHDFVIKCYVS